MKDKGLRGIHKSADISQSILNRITLPKRSTTSVLGLHVALYPLLTRRTLEMKVVEAEG